MTTEYIILTPKWSDVLPGLLAARDNLRRVLAADDAECDGREEGYCTIHSSSFEDMGSRCLIASDRTRLAAWRRETDQALRSTEAELAHMARVADIAVDQNSVPDVDEDEERERYGFSITGLPDGGATVIFADHPAHHRLTGKVEVSFSEATIRRMLRAGHEAKHAENG